MFVPEPTYETCVRESQALAAAAPEIVTYAEIGKTAQGRAIPLLKLTDPGVPTDQKMVLFVSGGTDGSEEVGRAVALGFARALTAPEQRIHLQRQVVLVAPVTNPDGSAQNLADRLGNGVVPATEVHRPGEPPATAEGRALRDLVETWIPDCHMDFHGLAGGGMGDTAYLYPTVNHKHSIPILYEVCGEMSDAAARAGYPQDRQPRLWTEPRHNLPGWLARNHSTFCMVLEGTENYYPLEDSVRSGVIRLLKLMEIGEDLRYFQVHPNYPCDVVSGSRMGALMPIGDNYSARRRSRRELSQMILQGVPYFGRQPGDRGWTATLELPVQESVKTLPAGMVLQATLDRRVEIKKVLWQDHVLEPALVTQWSTPAGIIVRATVPEAPVRGMNRLKIQYAAPFRRHVEPAP